MPGDILLSGHGEGDGAGLHVPPVTLTVEFALVTPGVVYPETTSSRSVTCELLWATYTGAGCVIVMVLFSTTRPLAPCSEKH